MAELKNCTRKTPLFIIGFCLFTSLNCGIGKMSLPTVDGPEATDLVSQVKGTIVLDKPPGGIVSISFPTLEEVIVRPQSEDGSIIYALNGPDKKGRIAFIESYMMGKKHHLLKIIRLNGTKEEEIFLRQGDALWDHVIGEHLALAPSCGLVAFVGPLEKAQMDNPPVLFEEGELEISDVVIKVTHKAGITAMNDRISWFPDEKHLAYVELVARETIPADDWESFEKSDGFGKSFKNWKRVPAVYVVEIETGKKEYLHLGLNPVVSSDGKSVLVSDLDGLMRIVEISSRISQSVQWIGDTWRGAIALFDDGLVLHWGLPTTGMPPRWTSNNSPLVGPKPMRSLKLTQRGTAKFQTVVPYIDPRRIVSFGCNGL